MPADPTFAIPALPSPAQTDMNAVTTPKTTVLVQAAVLADTPREWLTFSLGNEEYGIDILRVQEIRSYEVPTRIAGSPSFFKGVVNLRGEIVPIVDMRLKMNLAKADFNGSTIVIVLNIGHLAIGMVVDAVADVITLDPDQLCPVPEFNAAVRGNHLLAIGTIEGRMLILIDIVKLMSSSDMGLFDQALQ